jgi:hypothetical protein
LLGFAFLTIARWAGQERVEQDFSLKHPDEKRLYEAALDKSQLTPDERQHLAACDDCRQLIATFARQRRANSFSGETKLSDLKS